LILSQGILVNFPVRVLLVFGTGEQSASRLQQYLTRRKCHVQCARSFDQGLALVERESFDLVLGPINAQGSKRSRLAASLLNSSSYLFFSLTVEDGCWWLPVVRNGKHCLGAAALRSREFLPALDKLILEKQGRRRAEEKIGRHSSEMAST
jgi:hypothetical protein